MDIHNTSYIESYRASSLAGDFDVENYLRSSRRENTIMRDRSGALVALRAGASASWRHLLQ